MGKGQTRNRLGRAALLTASSSSRPLLKGHDHGDPFFVKAQDVGASGDRWVEPFLAANMIGLRRLDLRYEIRVDPMPRVMLTPGPRIGAIPLLNPASQKVAAGLLIEPRFRWPALGAVFNEIGFSVEPSLGGAQLVPGSAREVPPWMLAGPVIRRIAALLQHPRRGFVERTENRMNPRGRVDWTSWATTQVPRGAWTSFPCTFSEPEHDPALFSFVRWTLAHLLDDLSSMVWSPPVRYLLERAAELQFVVGTGALRRPSSNWSMAGASEWVKEAVQAMTWVSEERGLGGARSLDGLAWDLSVDEVWEAWVAALSADLGRQLGLTASTFQAGGRALRWHGTTQSMGALVPDVELRGTERVIWLDAKYKAHLELLAHKGWNGLSQDVQNAHRADLHQALAYASLADAPRVDTLLVYPCIGDDRRLPATVASVTSGRRQVRLILVGVPFGFNNPDHREQCLRSLRELLAS